MNLNQANVLVVDDEAALCEIFAKWLRIAGCHQVYTAGNGEEAVEVISREKIDVLITDVRMPVMDGITLVRRLSSLENRIACIIFVSGFGELDLREMYDLGVEAFLAKPFRIEDLSTALKNSIASRHSLWNNPMSVLPRQSITIHPEADAPASEPECHFRLGRGGFSAHSEEEVALGKITFECLPTHDHPAITGQGYVRWRSKADQSVGIEFSFLERPGRDWVVTTIEQENPHSFIPAL